MNPVSSENLTLVTVTYGDRMRYCAELLHRSFAVEGVSRAVIVSNNSSSNLDELEKRWGDRVDIISVSENSGSANGYLLGIKAALDAGAEYLWLMDDDNAPLEGALSKLFDSLQQSISKFGANKVAMVGFRPDHQSDIAMGVPPRLASPPRSSYFGFHVGRIPYKLWRRAPWGRPNRLSPKTIVLLPYAPYGGFLAHRSVFEEIGLPKKSLVLYADDTEYTWRLVKAGGKIFLDTQAILEDLEGSWNIKARFANVFQNLLFGGSDLRAYYGARNQAWFDKNEWASSRLLFLINRAVFLSILRYYGRRGNAHARLALIERALADGEAGRLGQHSDYTL